MLGQHKLTRQTFGDAEPSFDLGEQQHAAIGRRAPPSKSTRTGLPQTVRKSLLAALPSVMAEAHSVAADLTDDVAQHAGDLGTVGGFATAQEDRHRLTDAGRGRRATRPAWWRFGIRRDSPC
jgi:hypothetical protein